jgi:collagenase-like PrtC family protease
MNEETRELIARVGERSRDIHVRLNTPAQREAWLEFQRAVRALEEAGKSAPSIGDPE